MPVGAFSQLALITHVHLLYTILSAGCCCLLCPLWRSATRARMRCVCAHMRAYVPELLFEMLHWTRLSPWHCTVKHSTSDLNKPVVCRAPFVKVLIPRTIFPAKRFRQFCKFLSANSFWHPIVSVLRFPFILFWLLCEMCSANWCLPRIIFCIE